MATRFASSTFTSEFGHEFEAERMAWLRRRFLWYLAVSIGFSIVGLIVGAAGAGRDDWGGAGAIAYIVRAVGLLVALGAFAYVWRHRVPRVPVLTIVFWLILGMGALVLLTGPIVLGPATEQAREGFRRASNEPGSIKLEGLPVTIKTGNENAEGTPPSEKPPDPSGLSAQQRELVERSLATLLAGSVGVWTIFASHFFACVFLPWTARESLRPLLPLIGLNAIITSIYAASALVSGGWSWAIFGAALGLMAGSMLIPLPGMLVCMWRHGRFRKRFTFNTLRGRYTELRAELTSARTIHEALFPKPCLHGPVRFSYVYEPMRQIGGDYLYACFTPGRASGAVVLNVVVIDVTGHGIPAALTVNRLHGELERIFAEDPGIGPGQVLSLLNRYVHLTLATHSVYVTALCFRVDALAGTLEYSSGGHPPAFLRAVDGTIEQLDSTTFVLGACAAADFKAEPRSLRFMPGDVLIAYTDGATEARDARGRFLGIKGIQRLVATGRPDPHAGWSGAILRAVNQHRQGPAADDTLVIEIVRPLDTGPAPRARTAAASAVSP